MNSLFIQQFEQAFDPDDWYCEWVAKLDARPTPSDVKFYAEQKVAELQQELASQAALPRFGGQRRVDWCIQDEIDYYSGLTDIEHAPQVRLSSALWWGGKVDAVAYLYVEAHVEEFDFVGFTGGCTYTRKSFLTPPAESSEESNG